MCRKRQPIILFGKMQITPLSQPSVCHFCMSIFQSVSPPIVALEMLYMGPQLTTGRACPIWLQVKWQAQVHRGQWEWEKDMRRQGRGFKGSESCLFAGPGDWLTGVWIGHSRGKGWNLSHDWKDTWHVCTWQECALMSPHSCWVRSHTCTYTQSCRHMHVQRSFSVQWSFWNVKITQQRHADKSFHLGKF